MDCKHGAVIVAVSISVSTPANTEIVNVIVLTRPVTVPGMHKRSRHNMLCVVPSELAA